MKELRKDVTELQVGMKELRKDVTELQVEVKELRKDVTKLQGDVVELQTGMEKLSTDVERLGRKTEKIEFIMENELRPNICKIAEGHLDLSRKLDMVRVRRSEYIQMIYQHQFIGHQKNQKIADPNHPVAKDPFDSSECPRNRIHTQKM